MIGSLRQDKNGGAWCPKQQVQQQVREWIEVELKSLHAITAVQTQVSSIFKLICKKILIQWYS